MNDTRSSKRFIGIDLAKDHCDVACYDWRGKCVQEWARISYPELFEKLAQLPSALVLMEACNGAHDKARRIADLRHDSRLVNAADVKALRHGRHKNDLRDARYIAQLAFLPDVRFVRVKTSDQQDRQLAMNEYQQIQSMRIQIGNQIHSALEQYGIPTRESMDRLAGHLVHYLDERAEKITPRLREFVLRQLERWKRMRQEENEAKARIAEITKQDEVSKRLMTIPDIGSIIANLLIVHFGDPHCFRNSGQAAASIGLVPRQYSTGGQRYSVAHQQARTEPLAQEPGTRRQRALHPGREAQREPGPLGAQAQSLRKEVRRNYLRHRRQAGEDLLAHHA